MSQYDISPTDSTDAFQPSRFNSQDIQQFLTALDRKIDYELVDGFIEFVSKQRPTTQHYKTRLKNIFTSLYEQLKQNNEFIIAKKNYLKSVETTFLLLNVLDDKNILPVYLTENKGLSMLLLYSQDQETANINCDNFLKKSNLYRTKKNSSNYPKSLTNSDDFNTFLDFFAAFPIICVSHHLLTKDTEDIFIPYLQQNDISDTIFRNYTGTLKQFKKVLDLPSPFNSSDFLVPVNNESLHKVISRKIFSYDKNNNVNEETAYLFSNFITQNRNGLIHNGKYTLGEDFRVALLQANYLTNTSPESFYNDLTNNTNLLQNILSCLPFEGSKYLLNITKGAFSYYESKIETSSLIEDMQMMNSIYVSLSYGQLLYPLRNNLEYQEISTNIKNKILEKHISIDETTLNECFSTLGLGKKTCRYMHKEFSEAKYKFNNFDFELLEVPYYYGFEITRESFVKPLGNQKEWPQVKAYLNFLKDDSFRFQHNGHKSLSFIFCSSIPVNFKPIEFVKTIIKHLSDSDLSYNDNNKIAFDASLRETILKFKLESVENSDLPKKDFSRKKI